MVACCRVTLGLWRSVWRVVYAENLSANLRLRGQTVSYVKSYAVNKKAALGLQGKTTSVMLGLHGKQVSDLKVTRQTSQLC